MRTVIATVNIIYWLALTLWVSSLVAAGAAATGLFIVLPRLGLTMEQYGSYDHAEHGRLAAGMVMEPIFTIVDLTQLILVLVVIAAIVAQSLLQRARWKAPANLIRLACILGAVVLYGFRVATLTPEMNRELRAYWAAAEAGDVSAAREHRDTFDRNHPAARRMFDTTLVLLLVGVGASAVAMGASPAQRPQLELAEPELLRRS